MSAKTVDSQTWCEISNLIAEHGWRIDHGLIMETFALYARNPRLEFMPPAPRAGAYEGRDAVHGWFVERMKAIDVTCRHIISNIRMYERADGAVESTHLLTLFRDGIPGMRTTDPIFVADAAEVYVREDGAWKLAERVVTPVFSPA